MGYVTVVKVQTCTCISVRWCDGIVQDDGTQLSFLDLLSINQTSLHSRNLLYYSPGFLS